MPIGIIESLDHEARGITRQEGKAIFVDGALPGETVEYASSAFRSSLNRAILAPSSIVTRPAPVTSQNHSGVPERTGDSLASRKIPAFTMVAECR